MGFRGAIFDVDGVLVDSPHEQAWREGLRELMENEWSDIREQTLWSPDAFTPQVYQREMSGKRQFEGYEDLEELDWDHYREKYGNIQRLDRILRAEGDDPDKYKLTKQADAVLLFFLFPPDVLRGLFERLGYEYSPDMARKNVDYYGHRTSHGSTLSFIAHAGILAGIYPESSWTRHMVALESDVGDVQGGTTQEGIHMGVMAGTLDLIQRGYLGTEIRDGTLHFDPKPVGNLDGLSFPMRFRGTSLEVTLEGGELKVVAQADGLSRPVKVGVNGTVEEIEAGESHTFVV